MKELKFVSLMVWLFFSMSASAGRTSIRGTPPQIANPNNTSNPNLANDINIKILDSWNDLLYGADGVQNKIGKYGYTPKLAEGLSNANAYAASAGTIQGYQNYSLFSVSTGVMVGIQAPTLSLSYYDHDTLKKRIEDEGDIHAGASAGICLVNVGINADFLVSDLYLNIKFGTLNVKPISELSIKSTMIGFGANYKLVKSHNVFGDESWSRRELLGGLAKWRGISVGAGFIFSSNQVHYHKESFKEDIKSDEFSATGDGHTLTGSLKVNPFVNIGIKMKTITIPLEIVTSVQVLWLLNLTLGVGVDFNFGETDITLHSSGTVKVGDLHLDGKLISPDALPQGTKITNGTLTVKGSTNDKAPSTLRPKVMTGIGVNLLPVKIDIPIIYYPKTGLAVGVTVGVVW